MPRPAPLLCPASMGYLLTWVVALPFGVWLLGRLLLLRLLSLLLFVPLMADALQLHLMRRLKLGQVLGITSWWLVIVELVLQVTH